MANGRQHEFGIVLTGSVLTGLSLFTLSPQAFLGQVIGNTLSTFYNPDSDLSMDTRGENQVEHLFYTLTRSVKIGKFMKAVVTTLTAPYAAFLEHRSIYSHMPVLSDIWRHLYLEIWVFLFQLALGQDIPTFWNALYSGWVTGTLQQLSVWVNYLGSVAFLSYFVALIIQTCVHSLILDGGMMRIKDTTSKKKDKHKNIYVLGRNWYNMMRKFTGGK